MIFTDDPSSRNLEKNRPSFPSAPSPLLLLATLASIGTAAATPALVTPHPLPPLRRSRLLSLASSGGGAPLSLFRRTLVLSPLLLPATTYPARAAPDPFAAGQSPDEILRQRAASLPGLGPPDLYYPRAFRGSWSVSERAVVSRGGEKTSLPLATYAVRFLDAQADEAVLDRARSFVQADGRFMHEVLSGGGGPAPAVRDVSWTERNPNSLTATYADGSSLDLRVTKRALLPPPGPPYDWEGSEFRRVTFQAGGGSGEAGGVPQIYASRRRARWRVVEGGSALEGVILETYEEAGQNGGKSNLGKVEVLRVMSLERRSVVEVDGASS